MEPKTHHLSFFNPTWRGKLCPLTQYIIKGAKTVEGRKNSPTYQKIRPGDVLIIHEKNANIKCKVMYVNKYRCIREYLEKETLQKTLPCVLTIEEGVEFYNQFVKSRQIDLLRKKYNHGFLGIGIKVMDSWR